MYGGPILTQGPERVHPPPLYQNYHRDDFKSFLIVYGALVRALALFEEVVNNAQPANLNAL